MWDIIFSNIRNIHIFCVVIYEISIYVLPKKEKKYPYILFIPVLIFPEKKKGIFFISICENPRNSMICYPLTKVSVEFYLLDKDDTTEIKKIK